MTMTSYLGLFLLLSLVGCDPKRERKCEWYLVPEPELAEKVEPGWVALCARNYTNYKQRCDLKARLPYAKKVFGVAFKLNSLELKEGPYPKEVMSITPCEPEK